MFVIKTTNNGKYTGQFVAKPGHIHSYTSNINYVLMFENREDAEAHRCPENEVIIEIKP